MAATSDANCPSCPREPTSGANGEVTRRRSVGLAAKLVRPNQGGSAEPEPAPTDSSFGQLSDRWVHVSVSHAMAVTSTVISVRWVLSSLEVKFSPFLFYFGYLFPACKYSPTLVEMIRNNPYHYVGSLFPCIFCRS